MPTSLVSTGVQFPDSTVQTTAGGAAAPAGTLLYIAGTSTPSGYLPCDGAVYSQSTYPALFARTGTIVDAGTTGYNSSNLATQLYTVTYISQNGKFYTGFYGNLYDSTDGATWSGNSYGGSAQNFFGMMYGNGTYATVGTNSTYLTSSSGASGSWTQRSYLTGIGVNAWCGLFANGIFMVGSDGCVLTSSDAITWAKRTLQNNAGYNSGTAYNLAYGGGTWVAFTSNGPSYSTDNGVTWSGTSLGNFSTGTYGGGKFVAVNQSFSTSYTSPDGITWTGNNSFNANRMSCLTYVNGRFFGGSNDGSAYWSSDGITWTRINTVGTGSTNISGVAGGGSRIVWVTYSSGATGYANLYSYNSSTQFVTPKATAQSNPATGNMVLYIKATNS